MAKEPNWTPEDVAALEEKLEQGWSDERIGRLLGRSAVAINIIRKRRGIASRTAATLNTRKVAALMGVGCSKTVVYWIELGWLKGRQGMKRGPNRQWLITDDALMAFIEDRRTWVAWRPERITDRDIREWALELRRGVRFLTIGQVASRFSVQSKTVNQWIHKGQLQAIDYGNWWVEERTLAGFVPPCNRSKVGQPKHRAAKPAEDASFLELLADLGVAS